MAYLKLVSVTVASAFLSGLQFVAVAMLVTQGEQVAFERANEVVREQRASAGDRMEDSTGTRTRRRSRVIYARNGRRTGRRLRIARGDL